MLVFADPVLGPCPSVEPLSIFSPTKTISPPTNEKGRGWIGLEQLQTARANIRLLHISCLAQNGILTVLLGVSVHNTGIFTQKFVRARGIMKTIFHPVTQQELATF